MARTTSAFFTHLSAGLLVLAAAGTAVALAPRAAAADPASAIADHHRDGPVIQVALLLDDSGSMQGLIHQARNQLWELVGLLSRTTRNGQRARIEVALYHYGDLPALERPLVDFTGDLDRVSESLFSINGGGGTEACGQVIGQALRQLAWRRGPDALRLLVIAGNEEFTQGTEPWRSAVSSARAQGVVLHTIHCGPRDQGISGEWQAAALAGGGTFTCIDQDARAVMATPHDDELTQLNLRLNTTYLAYGADGAANLKRQEAQDANAQAGGSLASRASAKATAAYENSSWDVVDAVRKKQLDVAAAAPASLPPELRDKAPAERQAIVETKAKERDEIQSRIAVVAAQRSAWLAQQQPAGAATLGDGLRAAVSAQAADAGFTVVP